MVKVHSAIPWPAAAAAESIEMAFIDDSLSTVKCHCLSKLREATDRMSGSLFALFFHFPCEWTEPRRLSSEMERQLRTGSFRAVLRNRSMQYCA